MLMLEIKICQIQTEKKKEDMKVITIKENYF